jgi:acetyl/propionyl-CoA carboxylase alpha subunit
MKYYATIDDRTYEIEINQLGELCIDGECAEVDFQSIGGTSIYSLLLGNASYEALVEERDDCFEVLVQGRLYRVCVQDERMRRLADAAKGFAPPGGEISIRAPMPGSIVEVPVQEGQEVEEGSVLVILESMKMENELRAPRAGVVSQVRVQAGQNVEQNETLVAIT